MKRLYTKPVLAQISTVQCEDLCSSIWSRWEGFESFTSVDGITSYFYSSSVHKEEKI